jgi:ATP phosphoribosyltransferase
LRIGVSLVGGHLARKTHQPVGRQAADARDGEIESQKEKVDRLIMLLQGALEARTRVGFTFNVKREQLDEAIAALPPDKVPTISQLVDDEWVDVFVVLRQAVVRDIIPELKARGAKSIVEFPLSKFID